MSDKIEIHGLSVGSGVKDPEETLKRLDALCRPIMTVLLAQDITTRHNMVASILISYGMGFEGDPAVPIRDLVDRVLHQLPGMMNAGHG